MKYNFNLWLRLIDFIKSGDPLTMGYFDKLDNIPQNKYKKILKNEKNIYMCVLLLLDWWSFIFHAISLSFDSPSKTIKLELLQIIWKFDGLWWTIKW
jgi:hypothetical protein